MNETKWRCADGRSVSIAEMTDLHVFNSLRMLFRRHDLPYDEMPESVDEARTYLVNYINNREREAKKNKSFIPRYFGRGGYEAEPWDEYEGSWISCH